MPSPDSIGAESVKAAPLQLASPQLIVDAAGVAQSQRFGDVYASRAGATAQAHDVYLAGVDLPGRWQHQALHTVLELGFGLGGNFLATLNAWRQDVNACTQLDYIAIEGFPIAAADFAKLNPNRHPLIEELAMRWPGPDETGSEPGFHCIEFDSGRVRLILVFWDVLKALVELNIRADSVYLDGFAPAKNPEMWSKAVLTGVRRLLKPGAKLASYSVAGALRADLAALGFSVARKPGFAEKKQRLEASLPIAPSVMQAELPKSIAMIGAGIVGLALADKLCHAGFEVTLFERGTAPGAGASGVPAALVHPPSGAADSFEFGIQSHAHRYAKQRIAGLYAAGFDAGFAPLKIFEQRKNGRTLTHLAGGWLRPACLLNALETAALRTGKLTLLRNTCVQNLHPNGLGATLEFETQCAGKFEQKRQHFEAVIVCNGIAAAELLPTLALRPVTGQVELVRDLALPNITTAYCGQSNIIPMAPQYWCVGNSYERGVMALVPKATIRTQLLQSAGVVLNDPGFERFDASCSSWVGTRVESNLRLPLIGALYPGVWLNTAHSSKGFITAFFAAEIISAALTGRSPAIPQRLIYAVALAGRAHKVEAKA